MTNFNFYKADKAYGELYLQFPRVLLYGKKYMKLSDSAKIAYMVFRDRLHFSLKNNWVDEENNVYFIFTNEELCELLNKSKPTAIKIKKELENTGLLLQKQLGFDPVAKRNYPNRLYLADLEVNATDIYQLKKQDEKASNYGMSGSKDSLPRQQEEETYDTGGSKNSLPRQQEEENLDISGSKDSLLNLYPNPSKDLKDFKDSNSYEKQRAILKLSIRKSTADNSLNQDLINQFIEESSLKTLYGEHIVRNFIKYSFNDYDTFMLYVSKLVFAHKSVQKEIGYSFGVFMEVDPFYEEHQISLSKTFYRCIQQERSGKSKEFDNYLFISFKNEFKEIAEHIKQHNSSQKSEGAVPLHNWLEN